jgi:Cdc6-like AAA superfamily ATPase
MVENYIPRKLLEKDKYYRFEGEYFLSILEEFPLDLCDLIKKGNKRIILLGDAGYGKSTELKNVFSKFVEEENPDLIPIFIELNTYSDEDIEEYIKLKIGEDSLDLLNFDKSKLVFLFDEFDQVPDKGKAERI